MTSVSILEVLNVRRLLQCTLAVVLACGISAHSWAAPTKKKAKADPELLDIRQVKDKLIVLHDGKGRYLVVFKGYESDATDWMFYGDGKTFYQQRVYGGGGDTAAGRICLSFWEQRLSKGYRTEYEHKAGTHMVYCDDRETQLFPLEEAKAKKILDKAKFKRPLWKWRAHILARDDEGTYYYVDRGWEKGQERRFRFWKGERGSMKQQKMRNVVADSEGEIFMTKAGKLRLILDNKQASWIDGKNRLKLRYVPVKQNASLIYTELGVYLGERMGTPCDDW